MVKARRYSEARENLKKSIAIREDAYRANYAHPVLVTEALWLAVAEHLLENRPGVDDVLSRYSTSFDLEKIEDKARLIAN